MTDEKLLSTWTRASADCLKLIEAAGLTSVSLKVLKAEFASVSEALQAIEQARSKKNLDAVMKNVKTLALALAKAETLVNKESKKITTKSFVEAVKKTTDLLRKQTDTQKDLFKITLVQQSHHQAEAEGKVDWKATLSGDMAQKIAKVTMDLGEYKKFASAFNSFASKYGLDGKSKRLPVDIWAKLIEGLTKSGYIEGKIKHVTGDPKKFILAEIEGGPGGKLIRDQLLQQAMDGLRPFVIHAGKYLDTVAAKAAQNSTWAFWSGIGAKEAAKQEASGGVVLEGTIGAWFDEVWDFEKLTGGTKSLALWAAMSELYAQKAAQYYKKFRFEGFVGPGSLREQSVFNKIEQPTFIEVLGVKEKVAAPDITWYVVDCVETKGRWTWTGAKSDRVGSNRAAALSMVKAKYGG